MFVRSLRYAGRIARCSIPDVQRGDLGCSQSRLHSNVRRCYSVIPDALKPKVSDEGTRLDVYLPRWSRTLNFSYIWLRDHCRCHLCYNYKTFQRSLNLYEIKLNIRPLSVRAEQEYLTVRWPDGHESNYEYKFLWDNSYEGGRGTKFYQRQLWRKATFPDVDEVSLPLSIFEGTEAGKISFMSSLLKYGFAFVSEVPTTTEATRKTVEKLFEVQKTFYGEMWSVEADRLLHQDTAYTNEYLGVHTDSTYFTEAIRLQIFHCLKEAPDGGETLLVDGFSIAETLQDRHPESFEFLSKVAFPAEYIGDGRHQKSNDVIFKLDPVTGEILQLRYNLYDRAPLSTIPFGQIEEYYSHLHKLMELFREETYERKLKLSPGNIIFIDNWRVLHGRTAFSGGRTLTGCFVDNAEFTSRARVMGFIP